MVASVTSSLQVQRVRSWGGFDFDRSHYRETFNKVLSTVFLDITNREVSQCFVLSTISFM